MGTVINGQVLEGMCINGAVVNGAVKDGVKFYERPSSEYFKFTIDTRQTNTGTSGTDKTFSIPTSNAFSYNWEIDWGDGSTNTVTGTGATSSAGITKTYAVADQYQITIRPAGSLNSWFRAFGFWNNTNGANAQTNKNKVFSLSKPLTVAMFANVGATVVGGGVCSYMFYGCKGNNFTFFWGGIWLCS